MKDKILGVVIAACVVLAGKVVYRVGHNDGHRRGSMITEKKYMEIILTRHYAYLVKQDGKESYLNYRYITKVRRVPVIHRDANGNEIDKGGR